MMWTRLVAACLVLVFGLTPMAEAAPGKTFGAETFFLDNGMQVVVIANHRAPVVHHAIWYKIGAADEPPRVSGIAHMLEHMMFKGTEALGADGVMLVPPWRSRPRVGFQVPASATRP